MKKSQINYLALCIALIAVCLMSCKRESSNEGGYSAEIVATIVLDDSIGITNVIAIVANDYSYEGFDIIARCNFENNGFNLKLPASLAKKYLDEYFDPKMMSNPNAKCAAIEDIIGLNKKGQMIGSFALEDETGESRAVYYYSDKTFTVKGHDFYFEGNYEEHYVVECEFTKGWNLVYEYSTETTNDSKTIYKWITSTQKPSNINFKWKFY